MKNLLLCDDNNTSKVLPLCIQYNAGIEMQAFYNPLDYENDASPIKEHLDKIGDITLRAIHGCFGDLCPGSFDPLVRETARNRFELSYRAAVQLKVQHIVFHMGYVPHTSPPDRWLPRCVTFWKTFLETKSDSIKLHIENLFELEPKLLSDLIDSIGSDAVDVNLDIGHAHCFSRNSVAEWIQMLGNRIGYVHLHDNHGQEDEHLTLGKGTIPLKDVLMALNQYAPEAYWALETDINEMQRSIEWLMDNGIHVK
jgi:sugar phosphate isomerase/epimerase